MSSSWEVRPGADNQLIFWLRGKDLNLRPLGYEFDSGLVRIHDNSYYSRACAFCPVLVRPVSDEFLW